jgi:signal transduction histidine kinase
MRPDAALVGASLGAVGLAILLLVLRVTLPTDGLTPDMGLPLLVAAALLCTVGLTARRHPTVAWLAVIAALATITIDLASLARLLRPGLDATAWQWLSVAVCLAAVLTSAAAVVYASAPDRRLAPWVVVVGWIGVAIVVAAGAWALADPSDPAAVSDEGSPLGALGRVTRSFLVVTIAAVGLGLLGDARPAVDRARRRMAIAGPPAGRLDLVRTIADELAPGRTRAREAVLAERSRIARDLHAEVVPGLRRAVAIAEGDGDPGRLASVLRETLAEVEDLGAAQHAIQLDIGGLVAALEWLAERTQDRSAVQVSIDVIDGAADTAGAPPREVEAAAFRVAGLALDNVVRHAPGAVVAIAIEASAVRVRMSIVDDGPGLRRDAAWRDSGRRGLADMVTEAAACGATVDVEPGDDGRGTAVRFAWTRG